MTNFSVNVKGDLAGAVASAAMALPGNIIYGLIAFAPLGPEHAGQGILAGLYASVFAGFVAALFGGAEGTISGPRAPTVVVFDVLIAVVLGVVTSVVIFIVQMSKTVVRNVFDGSKLRSRKQRHLKTVDALRAHGGKIAIIELQGPSFFGATDRLLQQVDELVDAGTEYIILDFKRVNAADISAATVLMRTCTQLGQKGVAVVLSYLHEGTKLWTFLGDLGV